MARDPWKKAHDIKKLADKEPGQTKRPGLNKPRRSLAWLGWIVFVIILGALAAAWFGRGWWLPRYRDKLPGAVTDTIQEPRIYVDYPWMDDGFGINLRLLGDYLDLISATRDWGIEWQVTQTGADNLKLSADGIEVYVQRGIIRTYVLRVKEVFESKAWKDWQPQLREAGLWQGLSWTAFSGDTELAEAPHEFSHTGAEKLVQGEGWMRPVHVLHFPRGWLAAIEGRVEFGPSESGSGG